MHAILLHRGWRGNMGGGGERERTVSIFSSSRGALRLTNSCFYKMGAEKPEQHCDFHQWPLWCLWWRAFDTPDGFNRLTRGLAASWKPGRRRQSAVSQHQAGPSEGCRSEPRSGRHLLSWCKCCDAGEDVFMAADDAVGILVARRRLSVGVQCCKLGKTRWPQMIHQNDKTHTLS